MTTNQSNDKATNVMDVTPEERQVMEMAKSLAERLEKLPTADEHVQRLERWEANIADREKRLGLWKHWRNREQTDHLLAKEEFDRWERENEVMRAQRDALRNILRTHKLKWVWDQMVEKAPGTLPEVNHWN